jgi:PncC family amidohydrolase
MESLEDVLGELLVRRGLRLAVAESCTGGLVSHRITNVPGSSEYYLGGVTAYAYQVKERVLGVSKESLDRYGAVSQEVAIEMARGVRLHLNADIGVSVTGIAGPGGGTPEKPVGLTWIGFSIPDREQAWRYLWEGDRLRVKEQSAEAVLRILVDYVRGLDG